MALYGGEEREREVCVCGGATESFKLLYTRMLVVFCILIYIFISLGKHMFMLCCLFCSKQSFFPPSYLISSCSSKTALDPFFWKLSPNLHVSGLG